MSVRKNASNGGSGGTSQQTRKRRAKCKHHWLLENTKYPIIKGSGQSARGATKGRCQKCGMTKRWGADTPDSVHGIESIIAANVKLASGIPPELEEDWLDEENYD